MLSLSVPGKTFLVGEYLALKESPSLVLATEPRFRLKIRQSTETDRCQHPFHLESPAGRYISENSESFKGYDLSFENPYGQGGFGGSTAEFLLVKALRQFGVGVLTEHQLDLDVRAALSDYRDLHSNFDVKPSGADLVGQACGFVTAFDRKSGRIQIFSWPFSHLGFVLFKTGLKIQTHEHLRNLDTPDFMERLESLDEPCQKVWDALGKASEGQFLIGLNEVARQLEVLGLQAPEILEKTKSLRAESGIRAAKGCGALGADVVLVVFDRREIRREEVIEKADLLGLTAVATEENLSAGLEKDPALSQKEFDL